MLKTILIFTCYFLYVRGKAGLVFLEDVDGSQKLVPSIKIIRNGTTFTVTCVIEDFKSKKRLHDLIIWTNDSLLNWKRSAVNSITLNKPGTYYCVSDKYKLFKSLYVIVRDDRSFKHRSKRSQFQYPSFYNKTYSEYPLVPDSLNDFFEGSKKNYGNIDLSNWPEYKETLHNYLKNTESSNNNLYENSDNDWINSNNHPEDKFKITDFQDLGNNNNDNTPIATPHKDGFNIIYFFGIVAAFVIMSVVIYCLARKSSQSLANPTTPNNIQYCNHTTCLRHRESNPNISCYLSSLRTPLSYTHTDNDVGVTVLTNLISTDVTDSQPVNPYTDSPPTYAVTVRDSPLNSTENCSALPISTDLPPSYNQAVANMNLYPPSAFIDNGLSLSSTSLTNVRISVRTPTA